MIISQTARDTTSIRAFSCIGTWKNNPTSSHRVRSTPVPHDDGNLIIPFYCSRFSLFHQPKRFSWWKKTARLRLGDRWGNHPSFRGFCGNDMAAENRQVKVFDSEAELAMSLAKYTADLSSKFVAERGAFTVVLSGGYLIDTLRKLLESPYVETVEWAKWHVLWVDERVVPKDHEESNYKLAYDGFLSKVPILPGHVYAINDALSAEGAADDYETCLKHLVTTKVLDVSVATGFPKFDLMLLGMGPDGHVASLFPGHPLINESIKWVTFIKDSPKPPPERITFTFPVINSSAYIALVIAGGAEANAVHTALGNSQNTKLLPVQMVSPQEEITWFLDKEAASKL